MTQLTVTKLKLTLSSHFKVYFFVVLLFSFKTTFLIQFKTLTVPLFQSSPQTYHDKYICIYIYLYIYYTIKFLLRVCHSSFTHLLIICLVLEKMGEERHEQMDGSSYPCQATKLNHYEKHYHVGGGGRTMHLALLSYHIWLVWPFVVPSWFELPSVCFASLTDF